MKFERIARKVGGSVRVGLPAPWVQSEGIGDGDVMVLTARGKRLIIEKKEEVPA